LTVAHEDILFDGSQSNVELGLLSRAGALGGQTANWRAAWALACGVQRAAAAGTAAAAAGSAAASGSAPSCANGVVGSVICSLAAAATTANNKQTARNFILVQTNDMN